MKVCPVGSQPVRVKISTVPVPPSGLTKPLSVTLFYLGRGPIASTMAAFKAALDAAIAVDWAAAASAKFLAPTITIRDLSEYFNPDVVFLPAVNAAYAGTVAGDSLPLENSARFLKSTALSGKINRGAMNFPLVPESGQNEGVLNAGQLALYDTLGVILSTAIVAGGQTFDPTIFSPTLSNLLLGTAGIWMETIVSMTVTPTVNGVKRRKPKAATYQ